jgi:VIT1/CCC1 family predicted Fe2+/Mn2+ transporter
LPSRAAAATFAAFVVAGMVPLAPLFFGRLTAGHTFLWSTVATLIAFGGIGMAKGRVSERPIWRSMLETIGIGSCAAGLAYACGALLQGLAKTAM